MTDARFIPIEEYGVVGNLETVALVAPNGSVDWFPFPHIEGASILAAILDPDLGEYFQVVPSGSFEGSQEYVDRTNVLETRFETDDGEATVTDFLPPRGRSTTRRRSSTGRSSARRGGSTSTSTSSTNPGSTTLASTRRSRRPTGASGPRARTNGRCWRRRRSSTSKRVG